MSLENCTGYPEMPKDSSECVALLRQFNEWRRFDGEIDEEGPAMPHPKSIGFAIDMAIRLIEQRDELQKKWDYYQEFCKAQGANGITDLLVQRDKLLAAAEVIEINSDEVMDFDDCTAMLVPIDDYHKLIEAIAGVKGGA